MGVGRVEWGAAVGLAGGSPGGHRSRAAVKLPPPFACPLEPPQSQRLVAWGPPTPVLRVL